MDEIKIKQERITKLLDEKNLDGIILAKNSNISWLTGGMENKIVFVSEEGAVKLIVLKDKAQDVPNSGCIEFEGEMLARAQTVSDGVQSKVLMCALENSSDL